jgi:hypothetical protein
VPAKRKVLIADVPEAYNAIAQCLPDRSLHFAETIEAAKLELVQRPFHLIVVGLHFDESRLFKLLDFVRANSRFSEIPVVCVQTRPTVLPPELYGAVENAMKLVGATAFVQIDGRNHREVSKFLGLLADGHMPGVTPRAARSG